MKRAYIKRLHVGILLLLILAMIGTIEGGKRKQRKRSKNVTPTEEIKKVVKKPVTVKDTTGSAPPVATQKAIKAPVKLFIPVPEWVGKKFILLEKTKVFRKFGYELYTTPQLSKSTAPVDPAIELKNHRLKYTPFCKSTISVISVEKVDQGEYLVTFLLDNQGRNLYGKTKEGIIEGLAMVSDLTTARKRWTGKTIYCRRRCIDIYDSVKSTFTSIKVPITEPLKVTTIRWGVIPLPPKLLWIIVKRADGISGIIPVNVSWTNVIKFEKQIELPWEHELFEKDPKKIFTWDAYVWESIDKHNIFKGMTSQQVRFSWGEPKEQKVSKNSTGKEIVTYKYDGKSLVFEGGVLVRTTE